MTSQIHQPTKTLTLRRPSQFWSLLIPRLYLSLIALVAVFPLFWALLTSLKENPDIVSIPPTFLPGSLTLSHYSNVLLGSNLPKYLVNTAGVALAAAVGSVLIGLLGGYGAARIAFRGKNVILLAILASSMVPGIAILVALYKVGIDTGLQDTFAYLVFVFMAWQMPTVLWMMRSFVLATSREIEEAAMIDGCGRLEAFLRVTVPQLRPGMAAAGMIVFVFVWNDWLVASILTTSSNKTLVQPGLFSYVGDAGVRWGDFMAYAMIATLPIIILFMLLQRLFVSGLAAGAVK